MKRSLVQIHQGRGRKWLFVLTLVSLVLVLVACAPAATSGPNAAAPAAAAQPAATATAAPQSTATAAPQPTATAAEKPAATAPQPTATATEKPAATATAAPQPTATAAEKPAAGVSFARDVMPIFEKSCIKCHGGEKTEALLSLKDYAGVMAGSENGPVVQPGDAGASPLVTLVQQGKMPKRANRLPDSQIKILADWVNAGAPNN